ncbi:MAG: N-acetylgalactosamine-6-sulfatase, partial [Akkermansiaceae bacterium]
NRHIHSRDDGEIVKAQLFNLEKDIGESENVAGANPEVVNKLLALAESAREDIGDYDRVGQNMRFFDPFEKRPEKPMTPWVKK